MKRYFYFVSYSHSSALGYGHGNVEINTNQPIATVETIRAIEKWLKEEASIPQPVVLNYVLLRTEEVPETSSTKG
jgi:hypothetical protein